MNKNTQRAAAARHAVRGGGRRGGAAPGAARLCLFCITCIRLLFRTKERLNLVCPRNVPHVASSRIEAHRPRISAVGMLASLSLLTLANHGPSVQQQTRLSMSRIAGSSPNVEDVVQQLRGGGAPCDVVLVCLCSGTMCSTSCASRYAA